MKPGKVGDAQPHFLPKLHMANFSGLVQQGGARSVNGHDVTGSQKGFALHQVIRVLPHGAVAHHGHVGVQHAQVRLAEIHGIRDALVQVVLMHGPAVPDGAHDILHAGGHLGTAVVLEGRAGDVNIRLQHGLMHLGGGEFPGFRVFRLHVLTLIAAVHHYAAGLLYGLFHAAALIGAVVAAVVKHPYFLRSGLPAQLHQRGDGFRMCVGAEFRSLVPADVRLDYDGLARLDEGLHAAQRLHGLPDHLRTGAVADGHQIRNAGSRRSSGLLGEQGIHVRYGCQRPYGGSPF